MGWLRHIESTRKPSAVLKPIWKVKGQSDGIEGAAQRSQSAASTGKIHEIVTSSESAALGCYARLGEAARSSCAIETLLSGGITTACSGRAKQRFLYPRGLMRAADAERSAACLETSIIDNCGHARGEKKVAPMCVRGISSRAGGESVGS